MALIRKAPPKHGPREAIIVLKDVRTEMAKKGFELIADCLANNPIGSARPQIDRLILEILQRIDEPVFCLGLSDIFQMRQAIARFIH